MDKRKRQGGGTVVDILKLLVWLIIAFMLIRTDKNLDEKYDAVPPPVTAVNPVTQPPAKVK